MSDAVATTAPAVVQVVAAAAAVEDYEIVSHAIIDGRFVVMVKAPSKRHFIGDVSGWTEVPGPMVQP